MDFVSKSFDFNDFGYCVIIGEIGVNHNCDADILFRLIDTGIEAGLDVIKFQRFNSALEISEHAALADYQKKTVNQASQLQMAKELELPDELLVKAFEYCKSKKAGFLCTAFEHESVDFLAQKLGCKTVKVPSPEISNKPLLQYMAKNFDAMIVSTGASYLDECVRAHDWIKTANANCELAYMHCTSQYPAPIDQVNMRAIQTLKNTLKCPVGYSDHTEGHLAAIINVALGGVMLEKHYTLDKTMPGPDHQASVDIPELKALVQAVRQVSASLGDGVKKPAVTEAETRPKIRKSLYCNVPEIAAGTVVTPQMIEAHKIGVKRPYDEKACTPESFDDLIGRKFKVAKKYDEPIYPTDFEE